MAPKGPPPASASPIGRLRAAWRSAIADSGGGAGARAAQRVHARLELGDLARKRAHVLVRRDAELRDRARHALLEHALEGADGLDRAVTGFVGTGEHGLLRLVRLGDVDLAGLLHLGDRGLAALHDRVE